jgi:alkylated DNA repair dioxygenase AlkB
MLEVGMNVSTELHDRGAGSSPRQPGLFDNPETTLGVDYSGLERIQLDETSWIEHVPGWLAGSDRLFDELLHAAAWERRSRWMYTREVVEPRLTAEYPDLTTAPDAGLRMVAAALSSHYGVDYRALWINLYRDHRDSTGWHGDLIGKVQEESIVPVLSLGATRRFLVRPVDGGKSIRFQPAAGDLIVMGGRTQRDWHHSVPKQAVTAGARISVNFAPARY